MGSGGGGVLLALLFVSQPASERERQHGQHEARWSMSDDARLPTPSLALRGLGDTGNQPRRLGKMLREATARNNKVFTYIAITCCK